MASYDYPIIAVGAGAAGLVIAIGSTKAGKKALLIEKGTYGGDCTNFGCIPSKTLIHWAKRLHTAQGMVPDLKVDTAEALRHTQRVVEHFLGHENPDALADLGVETLTGAARFVDSHTLEVDGKRVTGENIVLCTGSSAVIPPIDGLSEVHYLSNESIFQLAEIPKRLGVLGGGPIGCELSQAFRRLGADVTIFEAMPTLLGRAEPEAADLLRGCLEREGVKILTGSRVKAVRKGEGGIVVGFDSEELEVDQLLVSVGRRPNVSGLNLEAAGVAYDAGGVKVDAYGRSSQKHIWAVGDCSGGALFTHMAEAEARAVLTSLILPLWFKKRLPKGAIPHVTFTDPEIACIGMSEHEAIERYGASKIAVYRLPLADVDRAQCSGHTEGIVKIVTKKWSSKILGACIMAPCAGEMLMEVATAMHGGLSLRKLAGMLHPYPVYSLGIRKLADMWLTQTIAPIFTRKFIT